MMIGLFFVLLPKEDLTWNFKRITITNHKDDKYQKVCKYLNAIFDYQDNKSLENYDIKKILEQKPQA
jgi:hypothetical protein